MQAQTNAQPEVEALAEALDWDDRDHLWSHGIADQILDIQRAISERMKNELCRSQLEIASAFSDKFAKYFKELYAK